MTNSSRGWRNDAASLTGSATGSNFRPQDAVAAPPNVRPQGLYPLCMPAVLACQANFCSRLAGMVFRFRHHVSFASASFCQLVACRSLATARPGDKNGSGVLFCHVVSP